MSKNYESRKAAEKLLKRFDINEIPIDLDGIAKKLGISVDFEELDDDVSGFITVNDLGEASIVINSEHHPNRQRFTFAHEIGHFEMHCGKHESLFIDKKYSFHRNQESSTGEHLKEIEANSFAASLLMPDSLIEKELEKGEVDLMDDNDVYVLARKFGVSQQALTYRLARLDYIVGS